MKTFITGGTGFIGTYVVRRLAQTEHEMVCLVRDTSDVTTLKEVGATLVKGDVTDKDSLLEGMRGCDWVVNLANIYTLWEPDKQLYKKVNVDGTRNVMECALVTGVSKVVHVSTMTTYGKPAEVPFTEESTVGSVRFSEYAETKYQGDLIVWEMYETKGLPVLVIYPPCVLGPGDDKPTGQYIQSLIQHRRPATAFDDSILTWVHVTDVAEVIVRALEKEGNIGEKYLVGKEQLSIQAFNELISEISGVPLPRMRLPDSVAIANARILTHVANLVQKPPMLGMSIDQCRAMKEGMQGDGSKAERELGITYTPIRVALEEAIASYALAA
ncbi:MAG: NAD-dependent epimerase/dehydratase family protein [bacterium]